MDWRAWRNAQEFLWLCICRVKRYDNVDWFDVTWNIKMSAHYLNTYVEVNSLLFNYKVILYESLPLKKATAQEKGET